MTDNNQMDFKEVEDSFNSDEELDEKMSRLNQLIEAIDVLKEMMGYTCGGDNGQEEE